MRIILAALIIFLSSCQRGDLEISQGGFLSSKELSNEVVVLNIWADWCPPCIKEMPYFNKLDKHPEITVLGFHFDQFDTLPNEEVNRLINKFNIDFKNLSTDPRNLWGLDLPDSVPTTYIIKNGEILDAITYPLTPEKLKELVATN